MSMQHRDTGIGGWIRLAPSRSCDSCPHHLVHAQVRGKACVLGCAVRSDQWTPEKIALVQHTIESFRIR